MDAQTSAAIAVACALALGAGLAIWRFRRRPPTAEELERQRRLAVNTNGKVGSGEVIDLEDQTILFRYQAGGMEFTASQDISAISSLLPSDRIGMIGPTGVKYDPRNPANSIVICEEWCGLRPAGKRSGTMGS